MIYEVEGDILLTKAQGIVQGLAPNDHFNTGLAFSLKEKYPELYKEFRNYSHQHHPKEGTMWSWDTAEGKKVYNLFTQEHARNQNGHPGKATTSYVNSAFRELRKDIEKNGVASIAIPKIATGVGGLDWDEVFPLIEKNLGDLEIPIYIYKVFHKDQQAEEA